MDESKRKQFEIAVKNPESMAETPEEMMDRLKAEQLYYNSGGRALSGFGGYEAGWKAATAYYEAKRP